MSNDVISICSWNVCSLGDDDKCNAVLSELLAINPHIALLQESKLESYTDAKLRSFLPFHLDQAFPLPAIGTAGGTITVVNSSSLQVISHSHKIFSSVVTLRSTACAPNIIITNIYAPSTRALKQTFFDELRSIAPLF